MTRGRKLDIALVSLVVIAAVAVTVTFVVGRARERERAEVRRALVEYVTHLEAGDAQASGRMLYGNGRGEDGDLVWRFNFVLSGYGEVDAAARERFGEGLSGMTFPPAESLADAAVTLDRGGRAATVTLPAVTVAARAADGGWRLSYPDLADDLPGQEQSNLLRMKLHGVAERVRAGEFGSAAEVDGAVDAAGAAAAFDWLFEQTRQRLDAAEAAGTRPTTASAP